MFEIELNSNIKSHLLKLEKDESCSNRHQEIQSFLKKESIPMDALLDYYNNFWKTDISLKQLMMPLNFHFAPRYTPGLKYTPEFKEHLEKLRVQQQEIDYQNLIRKKDLNSQLTATNNAEEEITFATLNKAIREQVTTVFNVLVSVASVVVAVWYWTGSSTEFALHYRVIACLFFGVLVLIADVVVYNSYLNKVKDAKTRERNKKETKRIVKKIII
ncbi:hypothetical protein HG535_0D03140 [Zygotorulaspora mrakii]|uniref:Vacuolar ATPase assembly integral membrane protein VPH2 n=1 Tax=Zygotorulaspora mrakii TaxID=42260 RepID=A0A7H9B2E9_ZYGMR|nr:uncharacterized protein HG535_0D03140 [Zygotorulaspora mrakii]QLG72606.1 hypothetical protein HG535_0D03140 [Zygotorulaspora mrakii]